MRWITLGWLCCLPHLLYATGNGGQPASDNPCGAGVDLYHEYPSDPTKYIQCDEWGHAYVRLCPRGHRWYNQHKTCVSLDTLEETGRRSQASQFQTGGRPQASQVQTGGRPQANQLDLGLPADKAGRVPSEDRPQDGDPMEWFGKWDVMDIMKSLGYHENGMVPPVGKGGQGMKPGTSYGMGMGKSMKSSWFPGDGQNHNGKSMNERMNLSMQSGGANGGMPKSMNREKMAHSMNDNRQKSMTTDGMDRGMSKSTPQRGAFGSMYGGGRNSHTRREDTMKKSMSSGGVNQPDPMWVKSWYIVPMTDIGHSVPPRTTATPPVTADTDPLNPCTHPNIQYIPHPVDSTKYFECIGGDAKEKSCRPGEIWRQTRHLCEGLPPPEVDPTSRPSDNPCYGTKQKYWPYLEDPRMYIQCQGWYEMPLLRQCDPGKVWVQRMMTCVYLRAPVDPTPPHTTQPQPTQPPHTTQKTPVSTDSTSNFCLNSDSFYHPYPPDSTKFIQCDEFGNMYIRYCGPKKKWDDGYKTCIGDNNVTTTNTSSSTSGPTPTGSGSGGNNSAITNSNDSTSRLDELLEGPCPGDAVYNPMTGQCLDMSALADLANEILEIRCPPNYKWDSDMAMCIQNEEKRDTRPFLDYNRGPNCEDGYFWDTSLNFCIQAVPIDQMISALGNKKYADNYLQARYPNLVAEKQRGATLLSPDDKARLGRDMPEYTGESPCGSEDGFYHPFPGDARYFIQCDLSGAIYVQPCGPDLFWNQELLTCTPFNVQSGGGEDTADEGGEGTEGDDNLTGNGEGNREASENEDDTMNRFDKVGPEMTGVELVDSDGLARNPCPDSTDVYFTYPYDSHMFVMCVGNMPFILACPDNLVWNSDITACDWPNLGPEEETDEEYDTDTPDQSDMSSDKPDMDNGEDNEISDNEGLDASVM